MRALLVAILFLPILAFSQDADFRRQVRSSQFTREMLEKTSASQVRALLNVTDTTGLAPVKENLSELGSHDGGTNGQTLFVQGYISRGDWGEPKAYTLSTNSTVSTNAIAIANAGAAGGRWLHQWDGDVRVFGVKADNSTDDWLNLQLAVNEAITQKIPASGPGGKTSILSKPIVITSDAYIRGIGGRYYLDGQFTGSKGNTNGGIIRTLHAAFPAWGDTLTNLYSRIKLESLALIRNWPNGGSYTGPLLMIDNASDVRIHDVWLLATNHHDWATFFRADNCHGSQIKIRTPGAWSQDGWHIYAGTNHTLVDFDIWAGDDGVVVGTERDQRVENFTIGPGISISDASRAIAVFQATYSTTPPAAPTQPVRYGIFHDIIAHGGQRTNWPVVIEEYSGANNTHTAEPPRVVTDIIFDNIITTRGPHQNSGAGSIRIEGTDRITVANSSFTNGNYASIWLNKTRNTTLKNVNSFQTVRTGSTGGSAGVYAYDAGVFGLNVEGGYYEAATGLHTFLIRGATNVSILDSTINSVANQYGIWIDLTTNFLASGNRFVGSRGIRLGTGVANASVFANVFSSETIEPFWWDSLNANTLTESNGVIHSKKLFSPEVTVGSHSSQANAALAVVSTTRGFQPPRMSEAQVDAIASPNLGLMAVDNDNEMLTVHSGSSWRVIPGWPRDKVLVNSAGGASFTTDDGVSTPILARSLNSWPLISEMYGDAPGFGAQQIVRRARGTYGSMTEVLAGDDLGGAFFSGAYTNNAFGTGEAGVFGRATQDWNTTNRSAELLFRASPSNSVTKVDVAKISADYPTTNSLSLVLKDGNNSTSRWYRLVITNSGGEARIIAVHEP